MGSSHSHTSMSTRTPSPALRLRSSPRVTPVGIARQRDVGGHRPVVTYTRCHAPLWRRRGPPSTGGAAAGEPDRRGPERVRDVCVLVQADPAPLSLLEEGLGHAGVLRRADDVGAPSGVDGSAGKPHLDMKLRLVGQRPPPPRRGCRATGRRASPRWSRRGPARGRRRGRRGCCCCSASERPGRTAIPAARR